MHLFFVAAASFIAAVLAVANTSIPDSGPLHLSLTSTVTGTLLRGRPVNMTATFDAPPSDGELILRPLDATLISSQGLDDENSKDSLSHGAIRIPVSQSKSPVKISFQLIPYGMQSCAVTAELRILGPVSSFGLAAKTFSLNPSNTQGTAPGPIPGGTQPQPPAQSAFQGGAKKPFNPELFKDALQHESERVAP
jgi:hypothetical protein